MAELHQTQELLAQFNGYPELPNGCPSGVLAYTIANDTHKVMFAKTVSGRPYRLREGEEPLDSERAYEIDVPFLNAASSAPKRIYYAAIETNPTGVIVATFPKGAQDMHAVRKNSPHGSDMHILVELGQRQQLINLIEQVTGNPPDLSGCTSRNDELHLLHEKIIEALKAYGFEVSIENMFAAGCRETKEEHGFDFTREKPNIVRMDHFVEDALSKRRPGNPIHHTLYAALVNSFEDTIPVRSSIIEEKNPLTEGSMYFEQGTFLTLPQMWEQLEAARHEADSSGNPLKCAEIASTESRLQLMERIERRLLRTLRAEGLMVSSGLKPGAEAQVLASETYSAKMPGHCYSGLAPVTGSSAGRYPS